MRLRQCGGQLFAVASGPNPRNFPARENCIKVAILLFAGYVDGATSIAESCGGGGSPGGGWGRDKVEDEDARARRAAHKASWLCKPMGRTYKRK